MSRGHPLIAHYFGGGQSKGGGGDHPGRTGGRGVWLRRVPGSRRDPGAKEAPERTRT